MFTMKPTYFFAQLLLLLLALAGCTSMLRPQATALPTPATGTPSVSTRPVAIALDAKPIGQAQSPTLIVTNAQARQISFVDPTQGVIEQVEVGAAPWGLALAPDHRLYVATAEGIAVVDVRERKRLVLVPYRTAIGEPQWGEYRPGGMGIAVSPDGRQVYVGVYLPDRSSQLEILDTLQLTITGVAPIGVRPFDVLVSKDGRQIFTIDHDSYTVTVIDPLTLQTRTLAVAPLGNGAFDKPHYAALDSAGRLWLPYQGQTLVTLDPISGQFTTTALTADTHQHGVAFTPDGRTLLIVGTGAAGGAQSGTNLTLFDRQTMAEEVLPLARPHEKVVVSPDGRWAYLTGGYLLPGGWDGLTIVDLQSRTLTELAVPDRPLDVVLLR